jgi:hypothetical protein
MNTTIVAQTQSEQLQENHFKLWGNTRAVETPYLWVSDPIIELTQDLMEL